jgi:hypothetical protein
MASDSGADDELRERVAQLEETVSEQQATIKSPGQPTASRRGLLSAAAGVAGLGALGVYSSSPASAQAAGQVGTASDPVDVEAYDLNVQNVGIKPHNGRPLWSESDRTIAVPGDVATVQEAVDQLPVFLRHEFVIDIASGHDASGEDVYVPPTMGPQAFPISTLSEGSALLIDGDSANKPTLNSVLFDTMCGNFARLHGVGLSGSNPYDNESSAFAAYGSNGRVAISQCDITGNVGKGVLSYASMVTVNGVDLGTGGITNGVQTKHMGRALVKELNGTVTGPVLQAGEGVIHAAGPVNASTTGGNRLAAPNRGVVYGETTYGINNGIVTASISTNQSCSSGSVQKVALDTDTDTDTDLFTVDATNNEIVVLRNGNYQIEGQTRWAQSPDWTDGDHIQNRVTVNGTAVRVPIGRKVGTQQQSSVPAIRTMFLNSGDKVDMRVFQDSGSSQDILSGADATSLSLSKV